MRGDVVNIPFYGIDRQPIDRQRVPGACEVLRNLRPNGRTDDPRWIAAGKPKHLASDNTPDPGIAEGLIAAIQPAEGDPGQPASSSITINSAVSSKDAEAYLYLTTDAATNGQLDITFSNTASSDRTVTVSFTEGETAQVIANRIAASTADSHIAATSGEYAYDGLTFYGVKWTAVGEAGGGNSYNVSVTNTSSLVGIGLEQEDFSGGKASGQTIAVQIGDDQTNDISISDVKSNNSVSGITGAIKTAINNSIPNWNAVELSPGILSLLSQINHGSENNKQVRIIAAGGDAGAELRFDFSTGGVTDNGINNRSDWGTINISIPDCPTPVNVDTAIINLNEDNSSIIAKIRNALEADPDFTSQYEYDIQPYPVAVRYKAKQTGPEYNSRIVLSGASKGFLYAVQKFTGGQDVIDGTQAQAAAWQNRSRYGEKTIDESGSLERIVALVDNKILIVDPEKDYYATISKQLTPPKNGYVRDATFSQVGETILICLSLQETASSVKIPEETMLLIDDVFVPLKLPPLPEYKVGRRYRWFAVPTDDEFGFSEGYYAVRIAWRFKDGTHSALSAPIRTPFMGFSIRDDIDDNTDTNIIQFPVQSDKPETTEELDWRWGFVMHIGITESMDSILSGEFEDLRDYINGIAVFVSNPDYNNTSTDLSNDTRSNDPIIRFTGPYPGAYDPESATYRERRIEETQLYDNLFYDVGTIEREKANTNTNNLRGVSRPPEDIASMPHRLLVEDSNTRLVTRANADESVIVGIHDIKAAAAYSYNKRYLLGNTSTVYADPSEVMNWRTEGDSIPAKTLKIVVGIDVNGVIYHAISKPIVAEKERFVIEPFYPYKYASFIEVWAEYGSDMNRLLVKKVESERQRTEEGEGEVIKPRIELISSLRNNFAYYNSLLTFDIPDDPPALPDGSEPIPFYDNDTSYEHEAGRFYASEPLNPFKIEAARTYYTENNEAITAFGVNAMPISSGQFGQYPLYVFTRNSISAMEQVSNASIAFGRISPVSTSIGCNSQKAVVNIGRSLMFMSKYGIYTLPGDLERPISDPINDVITENVEGASLGYYQEGDIQELWVSAPQATAETFCYSLKHKRWFSVYGSRHQYFPDAKGRLYSIAISHPTETIGLWREEDKIAEQTFFDIRTGAINFGLPDVFKRIWNLIVRWKMGSQKPSIQIIWYSEAPDGSEIQKAMLPANFPGPQVRPRSGSAIRFNIIISGQLRPQDWIESFDTRLEARYQHRKI